MAQELNQQHQQGPVKMKSAAFASRRKSCSVNQRRFQQQDALGLGNFGGCKSNVLIGPHTLSLVTVETIKDFEDFPLN